MSILLESLLFKTVMVYLCFNFSYWAAICANKLIIRSISVINVMPDITCNMSSSVCNVHVFMKHCNIAVQYWHTTYCEDFALSCRKLSIFSTIILH